MVSLLYALHVGLVILWIGGVAFVTVVIFPILLKMDDSLEQVLLFQRIEHRFARQAKIYAWLTGITGGVLLYYTGLYSDLFTLRTLGVSIMIVVWVFYLLVLTFEGRAFKRIFGGKSEMDSKKVFRFLNVFHWVVMGVSMFAVAAGVWQGHGGGF